MNREPVLLFRFSESSLLAGSFRHRKGAPPVLLTDKGGGGGRVSRDLCFLLSFFRWPNVQIMFASCTE